MNKYKILILLFLLKGGVSSGAGSKEFTEEEKTQQTEVLENGSDVNTTDLTFTEFKDFYIQDYPEATEEKMQEEYQKLTEKDKIEIQQIQRVSLDFTFTKFKDFYIQDYPEATEEEMQEEYQKLTKNDKFVIPMEQVIDEISAIEHLANEDSALFEEKFNELEEKYPLRMNIIKQMWIGVFSAFY